MSRSSSSTAGRWTSLTYRPLSTGSLLLSPLQQFAALPETEREKLLALLSPQEKAELAYKWDGWFARPDQVAPPGDWRYWLVLAGRGFGKTRVGGEWVREKVKTHRYVNLIAPTAADVRDVMIEGESGILAICPKHERPTYFPSKRRLDWPNGATSTLFSGEDPESLRGPQHEALWCDEIAAWQYPQETWDMALFGLRLGPDPQACVTTTPKPIPLIRELLDDPHTVATRGSTYANISNLAPAFAESIIKKFEGTRLGRQELDGELLEDEGLAYRWSPPLHVVPAFDVPDGWDRFEHMDYGLSNPTAWYVTATDYDGNLLVFDGLYEPGLPSEIGPKIRALRDRGWQPKGQRNQVLADPAIFASGVRNKWGRPASVADEFLNDCGIPIEPANNDRRAGHIRISELLRPEPGRLFPAWHPYGGTLGPNDVGAPRLFVLDVPGTVELRDQLKWAPVEEEGKPLTGEAVDRDWEGNRGHGHAALRYGLMSRPGPSDRPSDTGFADPRAERVRRHEERNQKQGLRRYLHV